MHLHYDADKDHFAQSGKYTRDEWAFEPGFRDETFCKIARKLHNDGLGTADMSERPAFFRLPEWFVEDEDDVEQTEFWADIVRTTDKAVQADIHNGKDGVWFPKSVAEQFEAAGDTSPEDFSRADYESRKDDAVSDLVRIDGVGPATAESLFADAGFESVQELADAGSFATTKADGVGSKTAKKLHKHAQELAEQDARDAAEDDEPEYGAERETVDDHEVARELREQINECFEITDNAEFDHDDALELVRNGLTLETLATKSTKMNESALIRFVRSTTDLSKFQSRAVVNAVLGKTRMSMPNKERWDATTNVGGEVPARLQGDDSDDDSLTRAEKEKVDVNPTTYRTRDATSEKIVVETTNGTLRPATSYERAPDTGCSECPSTDVRIVRTKTVNDWVNEASAYDVNELVCAECGNSGKTRKDGTIPEGFMASFDAMDETDADGDEQATADGGEPVDGYAPQDEVRPQGSAEHVENDDADEQDDGEHYHVDAGMHLRVEVEDMSGDVVEQRDYHERRRESLEGTVARAFEKRNELAKEHSRKSVWVTNAETGETYPHPAAVPGTTSAEAAGTHGPDAALAQWLADATGPTADSRSVGDFGSWAPGAPLVVAAKNPATGSGDALRFIVEEASEYVAVLTLADVSARGLPETATGEQFVLQKRPDDHVLRGTPERDGELVAEVTYATLDE